MSKDLIAYLKQVGVYELETLTTKILVKNPSSGEWIKGLEICLAEMGLITYEGLKPRTKDIFTGLGDKSLRIKYLIHRIAFLRAYYELLGFTELSVYRGMATTSEWQSFPKTFISYTTDDKVAKSFFYTSNKYKNAYFIKKTIPIEKIFMTFIETKEMNLQYKEKEVLVFYAKKDHLF